MSAVTQNYLDTLPEIYRDILAVFPRLSLQGRWAGGWHTQTLYERLHWGCVVAKGVGLHLKNGVADNEPLCWDRYEGCEKMERGKPSK